METRIARRVLAGPRRGSSRPVLVETDGGSRLVKLRGAAQGLGPLVAETIVGGLADILGLRVPAREVVVLPAGVPTDDRDDELADLLARSAGANLGFTLLEDAREFAPGDAGRLDPAESAAILWLDRLVLNPDRTARNPNLLWSLGRAWLIDHGAALGFQYRWARVTEATPREPSLPAEPHLLEARAGDDAWPAIDERLAALLPREALEAVVGDIPPEFLEPLLPPGAPDHAEAMRHRRAAYVAFLWKRLEAPRAFAAPDAPRSPAPATPAGRPDWLQGR